MFFFFKGRLIFCQLTSNRDISRYRFQIQRNAINMQNVFLTRTTLGALEKLFCESRLNKDFWISGIN